MNNKQIVAEMPKPENRYNAQFQYDLWYAFLQGSDDRARLLAEWRKVPSVEDLDRKLVTLLNKDIPLSISRELHRWLMEGK